MATGKKHMAIDLGQKSFFKNLGISNMRKLGLLSRLRLIHGYSHIFLPQFVEKKKHFDFIFIDGGHRFDEIFIDFYFSDLLLEQNGCIVLHDKWMRSTQVLSAWIRQNRKDYVFVSSPKNFVVLQKNGHDERPWYHFHELYPNFRELMRLFSELYMYYVEKKRETKRK